MLLGTAGGEDWYLILLLSLYSNPLALRALPLYSLQEHRGRGLKVVFLCFNSLALLGISLYIVKEILGGVGVILLLL